jgi:putative membrane protein
MSFRTLSARAACAAAALACSAAMAGPSQPGQGATGTLAPAIAGSAAPGGASANRLVRGDRRFLEAAGAGGLMEVEASRVAVAKATLDGVRRFAQRMVDDHGKAQARLQPLAASKGVTLPTMPSPEQQRQVDRLGRQPGAEFDRAYMAEMVAAHRKDLAAFRDAARNAKDAEVKAFAAAQLPTLEDHLREAQATESAAKAAR